MSTAGQDRKGKRCDEISCLLNIWYVFFFHCDGISDGAVHGRLPRQPATVAVLCGVGAGTYTMM